MRCDNTIEKFDGAKLKPKGMWQRTYYRLQARAFEAEQRSDTGFIAMARLS